MELPLSNRRAITRAQAVRYRSASRAGKREILDSVCAVTGLHPCLRAAGVTDGAATAGGPPASGAATSRWSVPRMRMTSPWHNAAGTLVPPWVLMLPVRLPTSVTG